MKTRVVEDATPSTWQMWLWAVLLPAITFVSENMCVWPAPRFLRTASLMLLSIPVVTVFLLLAALPASIYFAVTSLVHWNKAGEPLRRFSLALCCVCFIGLWLLAIASAGRLRHRAFVQSSRVGDRVVQALAQYRNDAGEYPDSLARLIPDYLNEIPYTGMIAYPEFVYARDRNDIRVSPGSFELRINCTSGGINFDRFIYWPSETYPDRIQGNRVERIGSWAYVHE